MARKPTDEVHLKLRFSEALRKKLANSALQSRRSLNAEIIHRLEQSYEERPLNEKEEFIRQIATSPATAVVEDKFRTVWPDIKPDANAPQRGGGKR